MKPIEPCHRSPFITAARSGLLSTAVHHLAPHQAQLSVKSWPEREAQSFTRHHKQQEADGQNRAFPPTPFPQKTSAHMLTGGHATPGQSRHFITSLLCSPLPSAPRSHRTASAALGGKLVFGQMREALRRESDTRHYQLTSAVLSSRFVKLLSSGQPPPF